MIVNRNQNKSLDQRERRYFGKDITNLPKLNLNCKKLPAFELQQPKEAMAKDAIHDYVEDIKKFIHFKEEPTLSRMVAEDSSEITQKMKQILIDWLVDVHQSFELKEQTLHLAILYLQEFQQLVPIRKEDYQLVGITCLWIASKYEEIYPPSMKHYVEVTAYTYTAAQIKQTQGMILQNINFNLVRITPLAIVLAHRHNHPKTDALTKYLLELGYLQGSIYGRYGARIMATAAIKLAEKICNSSSDLSSLSENTPLQVIQQCEKELCLLLQGQNKYKLTALRRKFTKEKYYGVGKLKIQI